MKTGLGMEFFVDYSHLLPGHPKCGVRHGHTAKVIVELFDEVGPDGMIMDFKDMENRCWEVLSAIDHHDLNDRFERPTSEYIAHWVFSQLHKKNLPVTRVQFFEGQGKWCVVEA